MSNTDYILLHERVNNIETWLRDNYCYQSGQKDESVDGVPQPCSWCGSHQVVCDKSATAFAVYCNACEYGTDWFASPADAWRAWNKGDIINLSEVE